MAFINQSKNAKLDIASFREGWGGFEGESFDHKKRSHNGQKISNESTTENSVITTRSHSKKGTGNNLTDIPHIGKNTIGFEDISFSNDIIEPADDLNPKSQYSTGEFTTKDFLSGGIEKQSKSKGVVLIEIALGGNRVETLEYRDGESIKDKAANFCIENGLDEDTAVIIESVIRSNLEKVQKKKRKSQQKGGSNSETNESKNTENQSVSSRDSKASRDKPAVMLELDLGGRTDTIYAYENDDPEMLAIRFCEKNNLDKQAVPFLVKSITTELKKLKKLHPIERDSVPEEKPVVVADKPNADSSKVKMIKEEPRASDTTKNESETYERWHRLINEKNAASANSGKKDKSFTQTSRSPPNSQKTDRSVKVNDGIYDKLYYQGVRMKREKEQKIAEHQREKLAQEKKELTFSPKVSPRDTKSNRSQSPMYSTKRYYAEAERLATKEKNLELERNRALFEICPFQPTLSEKALRVAEQRSRSNSPIIHVRLHDEADEKTKKREEFVTAGMSEIYTFKPEISPRSKQLVSNAKETQKELTERLVKEAKVKQEKHHQAQRAKMTPVDPKTGQTLFQPVIPHTKYYQKVKQRDDDCYNITLDTNTLSVKKLNTPRKIQEPEHPDPVREAVIRKIFDALDSDRDGLITAEQIELKGIEVNLLKVLTEVLYLLEESYVKGMNFEQFEYQINKRGLTDKIMRLSKKNLLNELSSEGHEEATSKRSTTPKNSHDVSLKINTLENVVQKITTNKSFKRSGSPEQNTSFYSGITGASDASPRLTRNYQKLLSQKTPR